MSFIDTNEGIYNITTDINSNTSLNKLIEIFNVYFNKINININNDLIINIYKYIEINLYRYNQNPHDILGIIIKNIFDKIIDYFELIIKFMKDNNEKQENLKQYYYKFIIILISYYYYVFTIYNFYVSIEKVKLNLKTNDEILTEFKKDQFTKIDMYNITNDFNYRIKIYENGTSNIIYTDDDNTKLFKILLYEFCIKILEITSLYENFKKLSINYTDDSIKILLNLKINNNLIKGIYKKKIVNYITELVELVESVKSVESVKNSSNITEITKIIEKENNIKLEIIAKKIKKEIEEQEIKHKKQEEQFKKEQKKLKEQEEEEKKLKELKEQKEQEEEEEQKLKELKEQEEVEEDEKQKEHEKKLIASIPIEILNFIKNYELYHSYKIISEKKLDKLDYNLFIDALNDLYTYLENISINCETYVTIINYILAFFIEKKNKESLNNIKEDFITIILKIITHYFDTIISYYNKFEKKDENYLLNYYFIYYIYRIINLLNSYNIFINRLYTFVNSNQYFFDNTKSKLSYNNYYFSYSNLKIIKKNKYNLINFFILFNPIYSDITNIDELKKIPYTNKISIYDILHKKDIKNEIILKYCNIFEKFYIKHNTSLENKYITIPLAPTLYNKGLSWFITILTCMCYSNISKKLLKEKIDDDLFIEKDNNYNLIVEIISYLIKNITSKFLKYDNELNKSCDLFIYFKENIMDYLILIIKSNVIKYLEKEGIRITPGEDDYYYKYISSKFKNKNITTNEEINKLEIVNDKLEIKTDESDQRSKLDNIDLSMPFFGFIILIKFYSLFKISTLYLYNYNDEDLYYKQKNNLLNSAPDIIFIHKYRIDKYNNIIKLSNNYEKYEDDLRIIKENEKYIYLGESNEKFTIYKLDYIIYANDNDCISGLHYDKDQYYYDPKYILQTITCNSLENKVYIPQSLFKQQWLSDDNMTMCNYKNNNKICYNNKYSLIFAYAKINYEEENKLLNKQQKEREEKEREEKEREEKEREEKEREEREEREEKEREEREEKEREEKEREEKEREEMEREEKEEKEREEKEEKKKIIKDKKIEPKKLMEQYLENQEINSRIVKQIMRETEEKRKADIIIMQKKEHQEHQEHDGYKKMKETKETEKIEEIEDADIMQKKQQEKYEQIQRQKSIEESGKAKYNDELLRKNSLQKEKEREEAIKKFLEEKKIKNVLQTQEIKEQITIETIKKQNRNKINKLKEKEADTYDSDLLLYFSLKNSRWMNLNKLLLLDPANNVSYVSHLLQQIEYYTNYIDILNIDLNIPIIIAQLYINNEEKDFNRIYISIFDKIIESINVFCTYYINRFKVISLNANHLNSFKYYLFKLYIYLYLYLYYCIDIYNYLSELKELDELDELILSTSLLLKDINSDNFELLTLNAKFCNKFYKYKITEYKKNYEKLKLPYILFDDKNKNTYNILLLYITYSEFAINATFSEDYNKRFLNDLIQYLKGIPIEYQIINMKNFDQFFITYFVPLIKKDKLVAFIISHENIIIKEINFYLLKLINTFSYTKIIIGGKNKKINIMNNKTKKIIQRVIYIDNNKNKYIRLNNKEDLLSNFKYNKKEKYYYKK
jgi:hypothetical protein